MRFFMLGGGFEVDLMTFFEYIGLFVFAASGAICAIEKRWTFLDFNACYGYCHWRRSDS